MKFKVWRLADGVYLKSYKHQFLGGERTFETTKDILEAERYGDNNPLIPEFLTGGLVTVEITWLDE